MSQQPQVLHARPTRQSASGPGDRIASARDVARFLHDDCRPLRDSLQLEMVVAQYLVRMRDASSPEGVPVGDATTAAALADLERHADPLSHAIMRAVAYLGTDETGQRGADAVARLGERGVGIPRAFADVAEAHAVGAWRDTRGGFSGEFMLFVEFEYPRGRRHSLALFVEPRHGGVVKHIGLLHSMSEFDDDDPCHPSALEPVEVGTAGALLRDVLDRSFGRSLADTDDYRVLIAAARARAMGKP